MNKSIYTSTCIGLILLLQGCVSMKPDPSTASCYYGDIKYGYIQGVSGKGVIVRRGNHMKDVKITCNKDTQEILVK